MLQQERRPGWILVAAGLLFAVLFAELFFSVRQNSQTFDESAHLYAGYSYWKTHDFGINPEHPPLAKMLAALPLLPLKLAVNPPPPIYFRGASARGGREFLYSHDAAALLLRARLAMSLFTFALALLVFLAAREMFGWQAALIALLLFVFEPNILANGALVTTDMAVTTMLFGTVHVLPVSEAALVGAAAGVQLVCRADAVGKALRRADAPHPSAGRIAASCFGAGTR
jgi:dolichyl-phosphate-mannose--protein O-mannosyl transferase